MTEIVLLRHGETEWDRQNRLHGHAPVSLTKSGRESVEKLGRGLASTYDFDRLLAADTPAARETVALVRLTGVEPDATLESAWRPRDAGVLQGLAYDRLELDVQAKRPLTDVDVLETRPRGGEDLEIGRERVLDRWQRLCEATADDETVLVVTHDFPIATIIASIAGADPVNSMGEYAPAECSITTVQLTAEEPRISDPGIEPGRIVSGQATPMQ
jgi:probable phosphoglycerate mutase